MKEQIRKIVLRLFPELKAGHHLPRLGRVVAVCDTPKAGQIADPFRPHYAVDIELLDEQGRPDANQPRLPAVPVSIPGGGPESGYWQLPAPGTWVEVAFMYGRAHLPFVRGVLPHYLPLPELEEGAALWQHSYASRQAVDHQGNWQRETLGRIDDKAREYSLEALQKTEQLQRHDLDVAESATETVGGVKTLEALGALWLLSGGAANLASLGVLNLASADDIQEAAGRMRRSWAKDLQHVEVAAGGKVWFGSDSLNVVRHLQDLTALVENLAATVASHTHPDVSSPNQAGTFTGYQQQASQLQTKLEPIIE